APPFSYPTPTLLVEAASSVAAAAGPPEPAKRVASPVYAVRREALARSPSDAALESLPADRPELRAGVDRGAYLHRYGAMDSSPREDLPAPAPKGAGAVLDVGCSSGATATALRSRSVRWIAGIEPDAEDAAAAAAVYDRVLAEPLEAVTEDFVGRFDA